MDPFSGTGTTPLVASTLGMRAEAVEINPFLVWLGNLKLRQYPRGTGRALQRTASDVVATLGRQDRRSRGWVPNLHQIEKWWDPPVVQALSQLFEVITGYAKDYPASEIGELLKVAFCRAVIENAHVSFGHQSMSFKKHAETEQQQLLPGSTLRRGVFGSFTAGVADIAESLETDEPRAKSVVHLGDARCLERIFAGNKCTTVVTSPPYPNRMSYVRELRPYMYWLGYLENGRAAGELDWQAIGGTWGCATSNLGTWEPKDTREIPYPGFRRLVDSISSDHELLGRYVHKYFVDMREHVRSLRRVMAHGGRCYYIVGNSKFYGTLIPVERIYTALFEDAGFRNLHVAVLRKRNSKKELFEYVVSAEAA
jgi:hypothetical protein